MTAPVPQPARRPSLVTLVSITGTGALAMNVFLPSLPGMAEHFGVDYAVMQLSVSGFHDETGSPEQNAELAKQRALAVRDALVAAGVAEASVELKKPEVMMAGSNAEARRVEVSVQ